MEKVLLLGSNGFIGRNLESYFSSIDKYKLFAPKRPELNLLDEAACEEYVRAIRPDRVIYAAVKLDSLSDTVKMFFNIYRQRKNFGFLYNIGSGAEYDNRNYLPLMTEDYFGSHIPSDTYGLAKYIISREIQEGINNAVNFRVFAIYGKHEDYRRRFISNNICRALCGKPVSINRDVLFDYIHVNDFCELLDQTFGASLHYKNYNLCTGKPVKLSSLANVISQIMGIDHSIKPKTDGLGLEYSGSNGRLLKEIEGISFTTFESGIKSLVSWYREQLQNKKISCGDV